MRERGEERRGVTTNLMFQPRILPLSILSNNRKIDIPMSRRKPWNTLTQTNTRINIQLLSHSDIPTRMTTSLFRGIEDTFQANFVAL